MKLHRYFERSEFACKCGCGFDTVDAELLRALVSAREFFDRPVIINSGCRCKVHNLHIGGSPKSQHLLGRAADVVIVGIPPDNVADYLEGGYRYHFGIGRYNTFTHIDSRTNGPARWDNRS